MRKGFLSFTYWVSRILSVIAGSALVFLIGLTVLDVVLRAFRRPILGAYELVAFSGAIAIGLALPITSWMRGHISVDFFIGRFPRRARNTFLVATRIAGCSLFVCAGANLIKFSLDLRRHGEVSPTLQFPFYPVVFALGIACFTVCLVLASDIAKIAANEYE